MNILSTLNCHKIEIGTIECYVHRIGSVELGVATDSSDIDYIVYPVKEDDKLSLRKFARKFIQDNMNEADFQYYIDNGILLIRTYESGKTIDWIIEESMDSFIAGILAVNSMKSLPKDILKDKINRKDIFEGYKGSLIFSLNHISRN